MKRNFKKIDINLGQYNLPPDMYFWIRRVNRDGKIDKEVTAKALQIKLRKLKDLKMRDPDNTRLDTMLAEVQLLFHMHLILLLNHLCTFNCVDFDLLFNCV